MTATPGVIEPAGSNAFLPAGTCPGLALVVNRGSSPGRCGEWRMMDQSDWVPEGIDTEAFSAARVYDYVLGGNHNFAVDREMARRGIEAMPDLPIQAQANRAFLHRAVRWLVDAGVRAAGISLVRVGLARQTSRL